MFHEGKHQDESSFTNKNQHTTISKNKTGFTGKKITVQLSQRERSTCKKSHEEEIEI